MSRLTAALSRMRAAARELSDRRVVIVAVGEYPRASRTPVAEVAVYQNDGTATITASHWVERAAATAADWTQEIEEAVVRTIDGDAAAVRVLGTQVAADIGEMCDRIDTGRLKASFRAEIR